MEFLKANRCLVISSAVLWEGDGRTEDLRMLSLAGVADLGHESSTVVSCVVDLFRERNDCQVIAVSGFAVVLEFCSTF